MREGKEIYDLCQQLHTAPKNFYSDITTRDHAAEPLPKWMYTPLGLLALHGLTLDFMEDCMTSTTEALSCSTD